MKTRNMIMSAILAGIAYVVMFAGRIPISTVEFLKYDPKDIIIVIGGFIMGPSYAFLISFISSVLELFTVSTTGLWGFLMNVISTCSFACTASFIYKKNRTLPGAIIGLAVGCAVMALLMLSWNYLITPFYMGVPRAELAKMLIPVFLPFNLLKGVMNAAITLIVYKPVVIALNKSGIIRIGDAGKQGKINVEVLSASVLVLLTAVLIILAMKGII